MVDIMDKLQKIGEIGKSPREKQRLINVNEVFYVWDILVTKLDIMETIGIMENFIEDIDLKFITGQLVKVLRSGIDEMEKLMKNYNIPFPIQPPAGSNLAVNWEGYSDRYIYISIFEGIQSFFPILSSGFMNSTSPKVRKAFKEHLLLTMELQELIVEYGKLKGFLNEPPVYRP
ncbi:hypothetical protein [Candidatus Formimonas warabiya]|uniref:DUF3231 family protein n=1 Tax=Formimonas warabiya TaxID=1761012 RepID=A0A3G1KME6_FORW1|nr:hypothetical protein [Candidatus Formimonas warabiya]ATW23631.1 hypothetical protein DCMF_01385 [Candidatus Formimonas warabiya]